ncbi:MAG: hypothetical protein Sapg2KO_24230 [Saprospiraceae bacterium]
MIELNSLYKDQHYKHFLKKLATYTIVPPNEADGKFYSGRERIRIPLATIDKDLRTQLGNYQFWQNHYLEDPSFWIADEEVLASISHENMVMTKMDFFAEILEGLKLKLYELEA